MSSRDWLSGSEHDFKDLCERWISLLEDENSITAFKWEKEECEELSAKLKEFLKARSAYEADDSKAKRIGKDEAKKEAMGGMREFANASVRYNKRVGDVTKHLMKITIRDKTPAHYGPPVEQPGLVVENTPNRFEHCLKAFNRQTGNSKKPGGVHGFKYAWQVGGTKPATGAELPKSHFSAKASYIARHTEALKGQVVFYSVCYENTRGDQGPWSTVEEAFIG